MADTVQYSPWNSPGQNTGVASLSLLQGIFPMQGSNPGFPLCRWILYQLSHKGSPRIQAKLKNTGVGNLSLLQGIFPTQESNRVLLHCRWILYQLSHKGSSRILEWVTSLLQRIFPTQGLNRGLLHCRRILYQLSYWGSPAAAKSLQSCPTLCDPIDGSPPGSPIPGILQARTLEWVAISFSNA